MSVMVLLLGDSQFTFFLITNKKYTEDYGGNYKSKSIVEIFFVHTHIRLLIGLVSATLRNSSHEMVPLPSLSPLLMMPCKERGLKLPTYLVYMIKQIIIMMGR